MANNPKDYSTSLIDWYYKMIAPPTSPSYQQMFEDSLPAFRTLLRALDFNEHVIAAVVDNVLPYPFHPKDGPIVKSSLFPAQIPRSTTPGAPDRVAYGVAMRVFYDEPPGIIRFENTTTDVDAVLLTAHEDLKPLLHPTVLAFVESRKKAEHPRLTLNDITRPHIIKMLEKEGIDATITESFVDKIQLYDYNEAMGDIIKKSVIIPVQLFKMPSKGFHATLLWFFNDKLIEFVHRGPFKPEVFNLHVLNTIKAHLHKTTKSKK
jgi:hypothetical protein